MISWPILVSATACVPLVIANCRNRDSTVFLALRWALVAWIGWTAYSLTPSSTTALMALSFTASGGVAVMGARRPGVWAWQFVVVGLLAVLWIGWIESLLAMGDLHLGPLRLIFLASLLGTLILNYLPTNMSIGSATLGLACFGPFELLRTNVDPLGEYAPAIAAAAVWLAWLQLTLRSRPVSEFDSQWLRFRNRFGAIWSLRLIEQFNRAAINAGWPTHLGWSGLHSNLNPPPGEWLDALRALQLRFEMR